MAKSSIVLDDVQPRNLVPLTKSPEKIAALIQTNLGGETLSQGDLDRAVNPSGTNTKWEIPDIDETSESASELSGVIVHSCDKRAYYEGKYSGGGERPDCYSDDGVNGVGELADKCGNKCIDCPMDVFGSAKDTDAKACKEVKRVYLLREGEMLPMIVNLTPQNLRALRTYGVRLTNKRGKELPEVISKFSQATATSKSGFPYAKVTISLVEELPEADAKKMLDYAEVMKPLLSQDTVADEKRSDHYPEADVDGVVIDSEPERIQPTDGIDEVEF